MTPIALRVYCSIERWMLITTVKHPVLAGRVGEVTRALMDPDEIRASARDPDVLLFHRREGERWISAVVKRLNGSGFLVTAYPADRIKAGALVWTR